MTNKLRRLDHRLGKWSLDVPALKPVQGNGPGGEAFSGVLLLLRLRRGR